MRFLHQSLLIAAFLVVSRGILAADTVHSFSIEAQDLGPALQKLATQSGVSIFYASDSVVGHKAKELVGRYTTNAALTEMLSGSGLIFSLSADGSISVKPMAPQLNNADPTTLPKVNVVGNAVYDTNDPYNTDYTRRNATTATKTDTPIMETPFNVQVVPRQVMEDRQSVRLDKALENISSVIPASGVGAAYGQQSGTLIRGFVTQDYYLDGVRIPTGRLTDGFREMANIQQVEVLKGPASILYGRMEPGGIVNLVTKKPLDTPFNAISQQFGSYDFYRTTIDSTGPLTENKDLLYRMNLAYENSGSFRDFLNNERVFLAPNLLWNISDRTKLNLHLEYQRSNNSTDYGFLAPQTSNRPLLLPISRNLSGPNTKLDSERINFGYDWSHAFNDNWKLTQRFETVFLPMSNLNPQFIPVGTREFYGESFTCTNASCPYYLVQYKQNQSAENYEVVAKLQI
ncbi:TonB-dependent receptor [Methylomonas sp. AM2-LC]|uniref:TonB-dependent siderophore receptor n=1 Tax=Methylomonas sp. AM2-LC TaxID=3153301 RepID=UPI003264027B